MMKKIARAISLLLAAALCCGMLGMVATAAFEAQIVLTTYNTLNNLMVSVTTDAPCGAVKATLTFDSDRLALDEKNVICYEKNVANEDLYKVSGNTITFVTAADDLDNGSTKWIDFAFTVKNPGDVTFSLSNAEACDVNETLDTAIAVEPVTKSVGVGSMDALGVQYRPATEANGNKAAIRFGTKLYRTRYTDEVTVDGQKGVAVYCGHIIGFEGNIKAAGNTETVPLLQATDFNAATGKFTTVTAGAKNAKATKCFVTEDDFLVHTIAITGIGETTSGVIGGQTVLVKDAPIVARAYVVYRIGEGNYAISYADQMSRTFSDVLDSYNRIEGQVS